MSGGARSTWLLVLTTELRQLIRDRRAVFAAVLLPALLYPLIFFASGKLESIGEKTMAEREVVARVDLSAAPGGVDGDVAVRAREALAACAPIRLEHFDGGELLALSAMDADSQPELPARDADGQPESSADSRGAADESEPDLETDRAALRTLALALLGPDAHVLVTARPAPEVPGRTRFEIWYDVQDDVAREGRGRMRTALDSLGDTLRVEAREQLLGGDPGAGLRPRDVDVASEADRSGAALGRWLPFLALLVLISGGAYAALAVFAGERESGTLETLLVQPARPRAIALGKFGAVLAAGIVTVAVNLTSLIACAVTGLAKMPGFNGGGGSLPVERLVSAAVVLLASCALLTALLCLVCGRARTFREGQMLLMPVTFAVILPTAIVLRPEAQLSLATAWIPFVGSGLGLREALEGDLTLLLGALVLVSHLGWALLLLGRVAGLLDGERALRDSESGVAGRLAQKAAHHGQTSAFVVAMALYLVAGTAQRAHLEGGLVFTFWVLLPLAALCIARLAPRPAGTAWHADLGLRPPTAAHLLGAVLLVPALVALGQWWLGVQLELLPMPQEMLQTSSLDAFFGARSTLWIAFFFALSPGLWEEFVFRGAILSSMRRGMGAVRLVLFQGMWFAFAHSSVYRMVPTFVLGALFAAIALRARSIWPTVAAHAAYNGILVLGANGRLPSSWDAIGELGHWSHFLAAVGLVLLITPARRAPAR